jgi:GntR family transcriptional regulator
MTEYLDKKIPTPLYYQLQQIVKAQIESGTWKPGETLPTEQEIMTQYGISRATVRQAILALVSDGYLKREKSKGTIVTSATGRERVIGSLMSFTSEMNMKGVAHYSRVITQKIIPADVDLAKKLDLSTGAEVYYLKRIRYVKEFPFLLDEHFIPYNICPNIDQKYKEDTSLYTLLQEEYKLNLHHGQIIFEPIPPLNAEMVELLRITPTTSLILAERIVYSENNIALDYFKAIIHGKFSIDMLNSTNFPKY